MKGRSAGRAGTRHLPREGHTPSGFEPRNDFPSNRDCASSQPRPLKPSFAIHKCPGVLLGGGRHECLEARSSRGPRMRTRCSQHQPQLRQVQSHLPWRPSLLPRISQHPAAPVCRLLGGGEGVCIATKFILTRHMYICQAANSLHVCWQDPCRLARAPRPCTSPLFSGEVAHGEVARHENHGGARRQVRNGAPGVLRAYVQHPGSRGHARHLLHAGREKFG